MKNYNCIVVLGPTASGKTRLACHLAHYLNGEIISVDSRQVYKNLNLGTGKDLEEYVVNGASIPFHLIDIIQPGEQFYLHQFIVELKIAFNQIQSKNNLPIISGGTGLYLDALRKDFSFTQVPENAELRNELESLSKEELIIELKNYPANLTQHIDLNSKKRIIRGIEIADYRTKHTPNLKKTEIPYRPYYIGVSVDLEIRKQLISQRLKKRMEEGLIEEVENLLSSGIGHERLELFGLEYKFVSQYLQKKITKEDLFLKLQTAIFQFAKRQMTWFRKMEKENVTIHWVDKNTDPKHLAAQLQQIL